MNILLINNNPVISRLLALCTRNTKRMLEEVEDMENIERDDYDIVFVDEALNKGEVYRLRECISMQKLVLFTNTDTTIGNFDLSITKPFLPYQITEILESMESKKEESEPINTLTTNVLDSHEVKKIKELLDMNEEDTSIDTPENLTDEEYEARKIKVIKEQLIAEGLEIVEEKDILDELSPDEEVFLENLKIKKRKEKSCKNKNKKKNKLSKQKYEPIQKAFEVAMQLLTKKQRKKLLKGKEIEISIKLKGED